MARPREFDPDDVVACAMDLFWDSGYHGSSYQALEAATGLNRSSLYNAFGGKQELFCRALDAYRDGPCRELHRPLREQRGYEAIEAYLEQLATFVRSRLASRGCLMLNTSLEEPVDDQVDERVTNHFSLLRKALRRAYSEGLVDHTVNPDLTAKRASDWLVTTVRGVLAAAAGGESTSAVINTIEIARAHLRP